LEVLRFGIWTSVVPNLSVAWQVADLVLVLQAKIDGSSGQQGGFEYEYEYE
jgi:hypothetical protein